MIGYARAFMRPVAERIKHDILKTCPAVLMDETTLKVYGNKDNLTASGAVRKSQVWTLNSCWTSPITACWCCLSPTRKYTVPLEILKEAGAQLKYLTTDGYQGYITALKRLQEEYGVSIQHTPCLTHLRRPLHQFLKDSGLLEVYNCYLLPDGAAFTSFVENLKRFKQEQEQGNLHNITPVSERDIAMLCLYFLINSLYVVETSVIIRFGLDRTSDEFKQRLLQARQNISAELVDGIYDIIYQMIQKFPEVMRAVQTWDRIV